MVSVIINLSSEYSLDGLGGMAIIRAEILNYYANKYASSLFP